jgi:MFS family permease
MFCPFGIAYLAGSFAAGWANRRWGRYSLAGGEALRACGLLGLAALASAVASGAVVAWLGVPLAFVGAGLGLVIGPLLANVLLGVPGPDSGAASGVLATAQQFGGALGVAFVGGVYLRAAGTVAALRVCFIALAVLCALVVAAIQLLPRGGTPPPAREAPAARVEGSSRQERAKQRPRSG